MKTRQQQLALTSFITILLSDIFEYLGAVAFLPINPTAFTITLRFTSLFCMILYARRSKWRNLIPSMGITLTNLLIFWNVITIIRGAYNADIYYDWRFLVLSSLFYFTIPLAIVIGITILHNAPIIITLLKKVYLYSLILIPLSAINVYVYARTVISVWLMLLLSAYINNKWRILIFVTAFFSMVTAFEIRANFLRVSIGVLLLLLYYFRNIIKIVWLKIICFVVFLAPLILLYLGVTGVFNAFQPFESNDAFVISDGGKESSNLMADTRTGLYIEVLNSVAADNIVFFGGGATARYKTEMFVLTGNLAERYGAEVGFLNTLLYSGIVGVLIYLLILCYAAYLGLSKSNNFLCKMLALFLAFRWVLFFIEDITKFDMNFYFLWIAVGMCFSNQFRSITDRQITIWVNKYILPKT